MAVQHWADALRKAKKTALISDGAHLYSVLFFYLLFCMCIYAGSFANIVLLIRVISRIHLLLANSIGINAKYYKIPVKRMICLF